MSPEIESRDVTAVVTLDVSNAHYERLDWLSGPHGYRVRGSFRGRLALGDSLRVGRVGDDVSVRDARYVIEVRPRDLDERIIGIPTELLSLEVSSWRGTPVVRVACRASSLAHWRVVVFDGVGQGTILPPFAWAELRRGHHATVECRVDELIRGEAARATWVRTVRVEASPGDPASAPETGPPTSAVLLIERAEEDLRDAVAPLFRSWQTANKRVRGLLLWAYLADSGQQPTDHVCRVFGFMSRAQVQENYSRYATYRDVLVQAVAAVDGDIAWDRAAAEERANEPLLRLGLEDEPAHFPGSEGCRRLGRELVDHGIIPRDLLDELDDAVLSVRADAK